MPGPSWFFRQAVKKVFKSAGADPGTAMVGGYVASTVSSLFFHDHHSHYVPDADQVVDSLSDSTDAVGHTQNLYEYSATPKTHFGSYDSSPETVSGTPSGSYLTSSSTIEPNQRYEYNGQVIYGSEMHEGSGGNVFPGSSSDRGQSSVSDGVSKANIKKVS